MPYDVMLLPGHPVGVYSRGGRTFHAKTPVRLSDEEMTDQLRNDRWLSVREVVAASTEPAPAPRPSVCVPDWLLEAYGGDVPGIELDLHDRRGVFALPSVEPDDVPDIGQIMIPVPAWLLAQFGDDAEAAADALEHCTGPFEALVQSREIVPAAEPEPEEPRRTRRKANHEADPEPEFGPPAEG